MRPEALRAVSILVMLKERLDILSFRQEFGSIGLAEEVGVDKIEAHRVAELEKLGRLGYQGVILHPGDKATKEYRLGDGCKLGRLEQRGLRIHRSNASSAHAVTFPSQTAKRILRPIPSIISSETEQVLYSLTYP